MALRGRDLYQRYCGLCHGEEGRGYAADNAPQLRNQTFLATATTSFLWLAIEYGRPGTAMAGFGSNVGGPLEREDVKALIGYLRSLQETRAIDVENAEVVGDPEAGRSVYAKHCASCHGERGEGRSAVTLSNPFFLATASDGFIRHAIQHGRPGTRMPAFRVLLEPQEIDDVTRFIRSWARTAECSSPAGEALPSAGDIVINPGGPTPSFPPLREGRYLPAEEVKSALEAGARLVLLDARPTSDWFKSHIPGAYPAPFYDGIARIRDALPRDGTWIIAYCACPHAASGIILDQLRTAGFERTAILDEGILVWLQRRYPAVYGKSAPQP